MQELLVFFGFVFCLWLCGYWYNAYSDREPVSKSMPAIMVGKALTENPKVDPTGVCSVCGYKDGHGWSCIAYYMNLSLAGHRQNMKLVEEILCDIAVGRPVTILRAEIALQAISFHKEIVKDIS